MRDCKKKNVCVKSRWRRRERLRERERERGSWQWIQALLDSVEQLCPIKCLASTKKKKERKKSLRVLHNNSLQRERQQRKRGMNDGEILVKSLNDRGQFLPTRRRRYNESTDWWFLRFKGGLIGSKRILLCPFRSITQAPYKSLHPALVLQDFPNNFLKTIWLQSRNWHYGVCLWSASPHE